MHCFLSTRTVLLLNLEGNQKEVDYRIGLTNRHVTKCSTLSRDVPIMSGEKRFLRDLIQLDLSKFDVILGMNWLTAHGPCIHCQVS